MNLDVLRKKIDGIDAKIVTLLEARGAVVKKVGGYKKARGISVYDESRESAVIKNAVAHGTGVLPEETIARIYREIIAECRKLEK